MANEIPAISVIIPMYNAEKYIAETLNSILGQTFQNFEVIVVNNCSTDNGVKIVESFIPKFNGKLKLFHTEINLGFCGIPRNKGLEFSRGKYIYFMDSDDVILINALEIFYNIAEHYQVDLLHGKKYLISEGTGQELLKNAKLMGDPKDVVLRLVTEDMSLKLNAWKDNYFETYPWLKFIRRDFLINSGVKFLPVIQEDSYWTFELMCLAKKIILLPNVFYVYRLNQSSTSRAALNVDFDAAGLHKKLDRIINGFKHIDEFMGRLEFFQKNPFYRYAVLNQILMQNIGWILKSYSNIPTFLIYEKIREAIHKDTGDYDILISCLIGGFINVVRNFDAIQAQSKQPEKK